MPTPHEATKRASRPFLDFYMEHGVIPTRQNIGNLTRHLERRSALYRSLGIIPSFVRGCSILEFGPGSGHNAVHTLSLNPKRYILVDANQSSLKSCRKLIAQHGKNTDCQVIDCDIESFNTQERFDLVLCEGVVPTQINPAQFARKVAQMTKPGGVVVITCMDAVSVLPEILRRYLAQQIAPAELPFAKRVKILTRYFLPHMRTLKNMSRKPEDWVIDVAIHPWSGRLFSMATALKALQGRAIPMGSSPKFLTDWRWYKDIHGASTCDLKQSLEDYHSHVHKFLDFRSEASSKKPSLNLPLIRLAEDIYDRVYAVERKGKTYSRTKISHDVQQVARMVQSDLPETAQALWEYAGYVKSLQVDKPSPFRHFQKLWGRGQQYISFVVQKR
jgi:2-polyprenyl-3-methyl-5-hydroxy-6-metoxy-1,4-benzoquinol methylase